MKALILLSILLIFYSCSKTELELDEVVLNGFVYDAETGKPIQDAKILIAEQHFLNGTTSEFMIKATTDVGGNFSVPVKKKSFIDYLISPPAHFDYKGCLNYNSKCDKPDDDKVFQYGLLPAAILKVNVYSSNSRLKTLSGRGNDPIFMGDFVYDTIFYKKIKPDFDYQLKWFVYDSGSDHPFYYYESPQDLNFSVSKFDTVVFDIFF